jgi:hypothetical protein
MTPEIRAFEYAVGIFAVLIGLAIADIATSFQRADRRGEPPARLPGRMCYGTISTRV